jgi:hypothetical protein
MATTLTQPILVRNTKLGPTVFCDAKSGEEITWGGANDPMGNDVQPVSEDLLKSSEFLRSISRGTFVIESAPEDTLQALEGHLHSPALLRQAAQWNAQQADAADTALETIDHKANNDIVTVACIGPDARGAGECGEQVAVKDTAKGEKAPLCPKHAALASQYVPTEDGKWARAGLAPRQTYQPISS